MFGIDLGISVSSVTCITAENKIMDYQILWGNKKEKNGWKRITSMANGLVDAINIICKSNPGIYIAPMVSIEEPVYPYRTRNPRSYFNMCCLYALVRNKLAVRSYKIYSINPLTVKTTAKYMAFKGKHLSSKYAKKGRLNKKGMIRAFKKIVGNEPNFGTIVGKETLADSYFIAQSGLDRRRLGIK